jgi:glycine/D-amino acid oxidase-like deaminating enzyme
VSACSGHGFKFSSALGAAIADLVTDQPSGADLALFRARSFRATSP